jgi:hypothetical protein
MTPTLQAELICPVPEPLTATPDDGGDAAYFTLAKKLGVRNAFMVRREIENALRDEAIRVYDRKAVDAWMNNLVQKENARLRAEWEKMVPPEVLKAEKNGPEIIQGADSQTYQILHSNAFGYGPPTCSWGWQALRKEDRRAATFSGIYPHAVPFAALLTMERIAERVPDAKFLVSNYAV